MRLVSEHNRLLNFGRVVMTTMRGVLGEISFDGFHRSVASIVCYYRYRSSFSSSGDIGDCISITTLHVPSCPCIIITSIFHLHSFSFVAAIRLDILHFSFSFSLGLW
mmetsp:Transcript_118985/g.344147  ORF Transcript_118985/g.344147 Transcript_118985/m.344147 type:complete len:107 (-) Transcript_118985:491-811(-)